MSQPRSVQIQDSIATQLLKTVFALYFIVALTVTLIHMIAAFYETKDKIRTDLKMLQKTFEASLGKSLWYTDQEQLRSIVQGILEMPIIAGVQILDENGQMVETGGQLPEGADMRERADDETAFSKLFSHRFQIVYQEEGKEEIAGAGIFYSSTEVVFQEVRYGFAFILINSIIKTVALWVIFLWIARILLNRPLTILTQAAAQLNLDTVESLKIDVKTSGNNELRILQDTFNAMTEKLFLARERAAASIRERARIENEMKTAQTLHEFLIPKKDPQVEGLEVSSFYQCSSEVGGDWYDYRYHPEHRTLDILIGDVSGHGLSAAMMTAIVNSFYHSLETYRERTLQEGNPQDEHLLQPVYLLELLNTLLFSMTQGMYHLTFFYSLIDLAQKKLFFSSAGHPPCYIWRPSSWTEKQEEETTQRKVITKSTYANPLGSSPDNPCQLASFQLREGDVLLWFTDGLLENRNPLRESFGSRRLKKVLRDSHDLSANAIKDRIIEAAFQHYEGVAIADDVTLIVAKIK